MDIREILKQKNRLCEPDETIVALQPDKRQGIKMKRNQYETYAQFIIDALQLKIEIGLHELIDLANSNMSNGLRENISYVLLIVKNDLEQRKIIKVERSIGLARLQMLRLRKKFSVRS